MLFIPQIGTSSIISARSFKSTPPSSPQQLPSVLQSDGEKNEEQLVVKNRTRAFVLIRALEPHITSGTSTGKYH